MITKDQLHEQVDRTHSYHRPEFQETMDAMGQIRDTCKALGHQLVDTCPISRELSLALTKLDDVNMYAIAALARFEPDEGKSPNTISHPNPRSLIYMALKIKSEHPEATPDDIIDYIEEGKITS